MRNGVISATLACFVALSFVANSAEAERVGAVELVVVYGYETPPKASDRKPIYLRDDVVADTELETVSDGRLDVRFVDETQLIVGPASKVKVDKFVFDASKGGGEVALNISKGLMRFVSGRMASRSYRVKTPSATLGVRGTDFIVAVLEGGETAVSVLDGLVELSADGGDSADVGAGNTGSTSGGAVSVGPTLSVPAIATASFGAGPEGEASDGDDGGDSGGSGDH